MINRDVICLLLNQLEQVNNEIEDKVLYQERLIRQIEEYTFKNCNSPDDNAIEFIRRKSK